MSQVFGPSRTISYGDQLNDGLWIRDVFGLNTFRANNVELDWRRDPLQIAFDAICAYPLTAAHVGTLALEDVGDAADSPLFAAFPDGFVVPIGLHRGTFYQYGDQALGHLLRSAPKLFATLSDEKLEYFVRCDSLVLYVLGDSQSFDIVRGSAAAPMNHRAWLEAVLGHYSLVVVTAADGCGLRAFATTGADLLLLSPGMRRASEAIESSSWYRKYADRLEWNELDGCLTLPLTLP